MDDTISRQAVINLLKQMRKDGNMVPWEGKDVFARIRKLPPAQPEPLKIDLPGYGKEDWERLKKEWGNTPITVLSAQPEIIRCCECKYLQCNMRPDGYLPKGVDEFECRHWCGSCDPMDFCSYAERRENG